MGAEGGEGRGEESWLWCNLGMMMVYLCTKPFSNARPI